jgi:hypothetical protein
MSPRRLAHVLLLAAAAFAAACNIGPQPLPPGAGDDLDTGEVRGDAGAGAVSEPSADAGAAAPSSGVDSGAFSGDGGAPAGDASTDASTDAGTDAASDAGAADAGPLTQDQ